MRQLRRALVTGILGIAVAGPTGCGSNTLAPAIGWELRVAITGGSNRPAVGDTTQMGAFVARAGGEVTTGDAVDVTADAAWSVLGPPGIVTVSATGVVTALSRGAVAIVATYGGKTGNQSMVVE